MPKEHKGAYSLVPKECLRAAAEEEDDEEVGECDAPNEVEKVAKPKTKRHKPNRNQRRAKRCWKAVLATANRIVHEWVVDVWKDVYVGIGVPFGVYCFIVPCSLISFFVCRQRMVSQFARAQHSR